MYSAKEIDRMSIEELEGLGCYYVQNKCLNGPEVDMMEKHL